MRPEEEAPGHDVVVLGGGVAALRAALAAVESIPGLHVALVSPSFPPFGPVPGDPGVAAAIRDGDTPGAHALDTIRAGEDLADRDAVEALVTTVPAEVARLDRAGCPWSRDGEGRIRVATAAGQSAARLAFAGDRTGFHVRQSLYLDGLRFGAIHRFDDTVPTRLVVDDGAVAGVAVLDVRSGVVSLLAAPAVVLADGGSVAALAYRAGVPLKDPEFARIGGVPVDARGRSPMPGLFAAGHGACPSVHGARRLPGNCLAAALVFGAIAGAEAARHAAGAGLANPSLLEAQAADEARRIGLLGRGSGGESGRNLARRLAETMARACGAARDEAGLRAGAAEVAALRDRLAQVRLDDPGAAWNTSLPALLDLEGELDLAAAAIQAALCRSETRGTHVRTDHPARDDARLLRHSLVYRNASGPRVDFVPVRAK